MGGSTLRLLADVALWCCHRRLGMSLGAGLHGARRTPCCVYVTAPAPTRAACMTSGLLRRASRGLWQTGRKLVAGQPTQQTHPEVFADGEVVPGILLEEVQRRRQHLASSMPPDSIAVLPGAHMQYMSGVIPYRFRQEADFEYLTGIRQPDAVAVLECATRGGKLTVFLKAHNRKDEIWNGSSMSLEAAVDLFGADEAYPLSEASRHIKSLISSASTVFYDADRNGSQLQQVVPALYGALERGQVRSLRESLHLMRWAKSPAEVELMRQSAHTSALALRQCIMQSHPGVHEQQIAASFEYSCKAAGADRMAYPPVVAGGTDACTIHYGRNDKRVLDGQLLLMDAGCELNGYVSDVTRTWPVNGCFSSPQQAVYEGVLFAYRACLEQCRPGNTLRQIHHLSIQLLSQAAASLGLAGNRTASHLAVGGYVDFYPHSVGHWLGLDTHDTSTVNHDRPLVPGVVMALEPGLYIPDDPGRYGPLAGIGVRIEDNVLIKDGAPEVLSAAVPIAMQDIEQLVGTRSPLLVSQPSSL